MPCAGRPTNCTDDPTTSRPCDDGNSCTIDDTEIILNSDGSICEPCAGVVQDCATGPVTVRACDDGNLLTMDDVETILDCDGSVCIPCEGLPFCPEWTLGLTVRSDYSGNPISCSGAGDGSIEVTAFSSPFAVASYAWNTGQTTARVDSLGPGTYVVTVTDVEGCAAVDSVTISEPAELVLNLELTGISCFGSGDGSLRIRELSGGTPPYTILLNGEVVSTSSVFSGLGPGDYVLDVTDANGCQSGAELSVDEPDLLTLDLGRDTVLRLGDSLLIVPVTNDGEGGGGVFAWESGECSGCPAVVVRPFATRTVSVSVTNQNGCTAAATKLLTVDERPRIYVPNAFSPNGDNVNDRVYPFADEAVRTINSFRIYDRWGELLWSVENISPNDPTEGWDGTLNGQPLNAAVFIWALEATMINNESVSLRGDVVLMR